MQLMEYTEQVDASNGRWPDFAHTGPGTLAGRYMRSFWQPIAPSSSVESGQAQPIRIMSEDFTLYRGETGRVYAIGFRCAHRGSQLSTGDVEGDCLRCLYHGWVFDGSGQCVEQQAEDAGFASKVKIPSYPAREFLDMIWVYLGDGTPPIFPPIQPFSRKGLIQVRAMSLPYNYFQAWENDWDEYHAAWTHRLSGVHIAPDVRSTTFEETEFGVVRRNRKVDGTERQVYYMMPNVVRQLVPTQQVLRKLGNVVPLNDTYIMHVPIDDEHDLMVVIAHAAIPESEFARYRSMYAQVAELQRQGPSPAQIAADILAGKATLKDYQDHPWLVRIQDHVAQGGQGRIAERGPMHERLGRTDIGVLTLRRIWSRELQAVAEGRPTRAWTTLDQEPSYPPESV